MIETANRLNQEFKDSSAQELLHYFLKEYKGKIALASSLGAEDQVITDMMVKEDKNSKIFTLDTGRLFPETYDLIHKTNQFYNIHINIYFPEAAKVEKMVSEKGINSFYDSIENRKECCYIRKIEPLKRAFKGLDVWICGLRHEQSITRNNTQKVEWDKAHNILKINPLIDWKEDEVWNYIKKYDIPYNVLHNKNFPSIGCQPCTRAVKKGEDVRSGRWWWERPETKECGLHVNDSTVKQTA